MDKKNEMLVYIRLFLSYEFWRISVVKCYVVCGGNFGDIVFEFIDVVLIWWFYNIKCIDFSVILLVLEVEVGKDVM